MVQGTLEIVAMCLGLVGLIGASATTGLPMWKVTAFIGENIIVMETRWEGLWMNCYRQANIRMQCKVYDSLLILPPDLQAARGLMCCSVALAGVALLIAMAGMRCMSCLQDNDRARSLVLISAGGMLLLASLCVFVPVSWTGHVIIRDFYNPLLIDAQRRELGDALYIGWVTGGFLFASGLMLVCRRVPEDSGSFDVLRRQNPPLIGYLPAAHRPALVGYQPVVNRPSFLSDRPSPFDGGLALSRAAPPSGGFSQPVSLSTSFAQSQPRVPSFSFHQHSPLTSASTSGFMGNLSTPGNSLYMGHPAALFPPRSGAQQTASYNTLYTDFQPVNQGPVFIGYHSSMVAPQTPSVSSIGEII
ncbi:claudin-8-like [Anguilla rostrata]|uniref:claudin-8-like n=1 Tax=Anguilla rostrata TaxID=7938 RepID=UPI0030D4AA27